MTNQSSPEARLSELGINLPDLSAAATAPNPFAANNVPAVRTGYTTACESAGFAAAGDDFVNGSWWGGESRNGEGLFVTRAPDGLVAVAFFTHRPPAGAAPE